MMHPGTPLPPAQPCFLSPRRSAIHVFHCTAHQANQPPCISSMPPPTCTAISSPARRHDAPTRLRLPPPPPRHDLLLYLAFRIALNSTNEPRVSYPM